MISVLFPTVRPALAPRALSSIEAACGDVPFEVIVVADFPPIVLGEAAPCPHLGWVRRERRGVVDAVNAGYAEARGSRVFLFNDESTLDPGALATLYRASIDSPGTLLAPEHVPGYAFAYYGLPFVPFPFAHRDVFDKLGGMLDPAYKAFYADPDLGMRAHAAGVPIRTVEGAIIRYMNGHDEAKQYNLDHYMAADQATFRSRWDHLGAFCDC